MLKKLLGLQIVALLGTPALAIAANATPIPSPTAVASILPQTTPASGTPNAKEPKKSAVNIKGLDQNFGSLPTNITSDTLVLHSADRVFIYKGNVVVTQGDMTLVSKTLEGTYNEQNQIQRLVAKGDVVITKQEIKATSQQALYEAPTSVVTLIENPQLQQKDSVLNADKIKIFLNENRSQAEGNVRVTMINAKDGSKPSFGFSKATPTPGPTGTPQFVTTSAPTPRTLVATPTATPVTSPTQS